MNYKKLGNTGLDVSTICLGTMTWGEQNSQEEGFDQMDFALDKGINFFDTAEIYPSPCFKKTYGFTEKIIGKKPSQKNTLYLAIPANQKGVKVVGDWNPLGMRGTVSRTLIFEDVFVSEEAALMPRGMYFEAARRWPHMFLTLSPTYVGLAQAAMDFTIKYLRGELPGTPPIKRRMYPTKQITVAEMQIQLETLKTLWFQSISEACVDPSATQINRAYATQYSVMEGAHKISQLAIRTCGGQAMLKSLALERIFRDSRCGSLMLPWTAEICLDRLGKASLYNPGEKD